MTATTCLLPTVRLHPVDTCRDSCSTLTRSGGVTLNPTDQSGVQYDRGPALLSVPGLITRPLIWPRSFTALLRTWLLLFRFRWLPCFYWVKRGGSGCPKSPRRRPRVTDSHDKQDGIHYPFQSLPPPSDSTVTDYPRACDRIMVHRVFFLFQGRETSNVRS